MHNLEFRIGNDDKKAHLTRPNMVSALCGVWTNVRAPLTGMGVAPCQHCLELAAEIIADADEAEALAS